MVSRPLGPESRTWARHMEFSALREVLLRLGVEDGTSECHGILCGLFCARGHGLGQGWLTRILEAGDAYAVSGEAALRRSDLELLESLYRETQQQFLDPGFGFRLLLPGDEVLLADRVRALSQWCRGFLYGIAAGGVDVSTHYSSEVAELLHDLAEISRAEGDDDPTEAEEEAFMEITEYIRLGVIFIYEELQGGDPGESSEASGEQTLH